MKTSMKWGLIALTVILAAPALGAEGWGSLWGAYQKGFWDIVYDGHICTIELTDKPAWFTLQSYYVNTSGCPHLARFKTWAPQDQATLTLGGDTTLVLSWRGAEGHPIYTGQTPEAKDENISLIFHPTPTDTDE